ncbi:MAG: VOC family protein [Thiotrichales bacterium]
MIVLVTSPLHTSISQFTGLMASIFLRLAHTPQELQDECQSGCLVRDLCAGHGSREIARWCILVARIARWKRRAAANGGTLQQDKMAIGKHGFIALVKDTEGNVIGLHSMT